MTPPVTLEHVSVTTWIAVSGLCISAGLAFLRIWETFFLRSRLDCEIDWIEPADDQIHLRIAIANLGRKPDCVRSLALTLDETEYQREDIREQLPVSLDPREIAAFRWKHQKGKETQFWHPMMDGEGTLLLRDVAHKEHLFPIPAMASAWSGRPDPS